ncbi:MULTISPECIES: helix-turn-helix domain-containing protein [unclassified Streptomyces]|uniref:helix-turn-helix domain-containing protein n=1 Tax=unclassified Streptomyces TaxID=2593676 RepID=UPI001907DED6|nr:MULTISPECIES: helix-turn-helix transcriptional regulator [unclassified Streptomyces]MCU4749153.1 helix-turn-helix transcriptional regulator [Streptomyces sp. G-5]QQN77302.1 helix-turn-helix transcriptional regulator [Streptomyces sp. XC 2026]
MNEQEEATYLTPAQRFGREVREVRLGRRLTQKNLGLGTGYSEGYVSKVEAGKKQPSREFIAGCDKVFATGGLFARLHASLQESSSPTWFEPYLDLERRALWILDYAVACVPGLLQTDQYARAIFRAGHPRDDPAAIEGKVEARRRRRQVLESPDISLWLVLHETCLRAAVGGSTIMRGQLDHLLDTASGPGVDIQVLPFKTGAAAVHTLSFTMLGFADSEPVLWTDDAAGGKLHQAASTVAFQQAAFDRLRAHALSPDASLTMIRQVRTEEYGRD